MNNTTKISLTIELEGSTLVRKSEPEIIKYSVTKRDLEPNKKWRGKDGLEVVERVLSSIILSLQSPPVSTST